MATPDPEHRGVAWPAGVMLAKPVADLPPDGSLAGGCLYEPKWDGYWAQLDEGSLAMGSPPLLTCAQADVVARLLDELAGVYRGEELGALAGALSQMIDSQLDEQR